ncbi:hypothetical protein FFLO_05602 [Filobasidium floriforme]|uniref:Mitochondrial import inner membrane translocase subunit TIM16 n=1 Tax=Filobasidium floriforme TaxID=5210 RepID=A0A8K0NLA9_9TREE|nr:hypothetical protein FFLO_05602 [Filobasidium floriforme]
MREAGRQAVANARHKPEGVADSGKAGGGSGKTQNLSSSLGMSFEEAQLILNVKKGDSMEKILENYERIFKANAKPEPPAATDPKAKPTGRKGKAPAVIYSHYLQSKVYRALERIKAEKGPEAVAEGAAGETMVAGTAAEGGVAPESLAKAAAEAEPFTGAGPGQGPVPGEGPAQAAAGQAGVNPGSAEFANKTAESSPEGSTEEPKREPIYNPAVGRAKPKGDKVADENEPIQL